MENSATSRNIPGRAAAMPDDPSAAVAAPAPTDLTDAVSPRAGGGVFASGDPLAPVPADRHVCPYCGLTGPRPDGPCARCMVEDSPQTRQATKARIGPWYVLQARNPAAPGMKWSTLIALVKKGQVTPRSVVRGPTTHQLWRLASQVKGLSREFGLCYSCGLEIARTTNQCPHCDRLQEPPPNPDALLESAAPSATRPAQHETRPAPAAARGPAAPAAAAPGGTQLAARNPRDEVGLLTARELAAAFQLNFSDPADAPARASTAAGKSAGGNGSPLLDAVVPPRRGRRLGRALFVLLLLAAVGGGAVVWFTPQYRQQAIAYWEQSRDWTVAKWDEWSSTPVVATDAPQGDLDAAPATPSAGDGDPADAAAAAGDVGPSARKVEPPPVVAADPVVAAPPTASEPGAAAAAPTPADALPPDERARTLRRTAIDAEAAGDYARAVELYEQITRLPREHWPSDLQLRLDAARQRLK